MLRGEDAGQCVPCQWLNEQYFLNGIIRRLLLNSRRTVGEAGMEKRELSSSPQLHAVREAIERRLCNKGFSPRNITPDILLAKRLGNCPNVIFV